MRNKSSERIAYLDGLRCVAIAMVLMYHYLARWTPPTELASLYPYGSAFAQFAPAKYGYFGVNLFFLVSGIVITMTLYRCSGFMEFAVRRFARLWPTMLLCATITCVVVPIIPDSPFSISARNLLPSLSFLEPQVVGFVFNGLPFDWMDGAYWSLWVEVRFYVLIAVLYFVSPARFNTTLTGFSIVVLSLYTLVLALGLEPYAKLLKGLFIAQHLPWFLFGVGLYLGKAGRLLIVLGALALIGQAVVLQSTSLFVMLIAIPTLVWAGGNTPLGRILSWAPLTSIGVVSYSLYLLHQKIGVSLIHSMGEWLPLQGRTTLVYAIAVAGLMIFASRLIYRYWETPANRAILSWLPAQRRQH